MEEGSVPSPIRSLRARASRGTLALLGGQLGAQILRVLGNLLLTRLLFPEAFGLAALVSLVLVGFEQLFNLGVQASIMRHERGDERRFLDTAWTIQVLRGAALGALGFALAPLLARAFGKPELAELLRVACFAAILMGFTSTKLYGLTRRLELERRVAIDLLAQTAALAFMIAHATHYRSVWALVLGGLVNQAVIVLLSQVWLPGPRNRFAWDREAARELFGFGGWVFASSGLSFLANHLETALLGRLVAAGPLGVYGVGSMVPNLLRDLLGRLAMSVLAPALSEAYRKSGDSARARYADARRLTLPAGLAMGLGAAVAAPAFFGQLYDARYADAGWIAQLALLRFWFSYLQATACSTLLALGDARAWLASSAVGTVSVTAGCLLGFELAELPGLLVGTAAGMAASWAPAAWRLQRRGIASPWPELGYTALGALLAALALGAGPVLGPALGIADPGLRTLVAGSLVLSPFGLWVARRVLANLRLS
jgi:O-antigen/teichoic acid export membrane protein